VKEPNKLVFVVVVHLPGEPATPQKLSGVTC
jgi:hypothetical protein